MDEFVVSTWPLLKPFFHPTHEPAATPAPAQDQEPQELAAGEADPADLVTPGTGAAEEADREQVG